MKKFIFVFLFSLTGAFALSGCHTVEGMGDDAQQAGDAIEDATDR